MASQRETHGVQFTDCPECGQNFGTNGLARHRKAAHGVTPAVGGTRKVVLDRAALAILREAAEGAISAERLTYRTTIKKLVGAGYLTDSLEITAAGRARLA